MCRAYFNATAHFHKCIALAILLGEAGRYSGIVLGELVRKHAEGALIA